MKKKTEVCSSNQFIIISSPEDKQFAYKGGLGKNENISVWAEYRDTNRSIIKVIKLKSLIAIAKIGKDNLTGPVLEPETSGLSYQCSSIWAIEPLDGGPPG